MASLGYLPFLLEAPGSGSCALLRNGPTRRPPPPTKRSLLHSSAAFNSRPFRPAVAVGGGRAVAALGSVGRKKGAAAGGSVGGVEEDGRGEEEEVEVADETLRATIEQSMKVLAVQKDLLWQIEERRKVVSSIKSSAVSKEWDTSDESDNSFSKMDQSAPSGGLQIKYSSSIISDKSTNPADILSVNPPISDGRKSFYEEKRIEISPAENSIADALGLSREASLGAAQSEIFSPTISKVSEPCGVREEIDQDLDKSDGEGVGATTVEGNESPLAGPNVMNVILVAAECAPWSKTGLKVPSTN